MDWQHNLPLPKYDDLHEYQAWIGGSVRTIKRIGNRSKTFSPGTLVFTDCTHPLQNVICDESRIDAWKAPQL